MNDTLNIEKGTVLYKRSDGSEILLTRTDDEDFYACVRNPSGKVFEEQLLGSILRRGDWEATYEIVEKHGDHDQSDHGSWATGSSDNDYGMSHRPSLGGGTEGDMDGASLDNVSNGIYPDDVYSPRGVQIYGTGYKELDKQAHALIMEYRGKPEKSITIYRAIPKDVSTSKISGGEWVTPIKQYAVQHGQSNLNDNYQILTREVKAKEIFTSGDSWLEWGYAPSAVQKHSEHDQTDHGNRDGASSSELDDETAAKIQQFTRDWGGLSIKMTDGSLPDKGFMVSKPPTFSKIVPKEEFYDKEKGKAILREYMEKNEKDLATGTNYLGTWENEGKIYLDVSMNISSESDAVSLGRDNNQKAVWDVINQKEIQTGGTGSANKSREQKTGQDGTNEGHFKYDRGTEGRLRDGTLGKINQRQSRSKVIYFDYGLKPVLKHDGHDDQSSHGNWARGFTEEEVKRIESMDKVGPSDKDILQAIKPKTYNDNQLSEFVEQDGDLYADATQGIDGKVAESLASLQAEFPNHEYTEQEKNDIFERVQSEMIGNYVDGQRESLTEYGMAIEGYEPIDTADLVEPFNDVFGVVQTGTSLTGDTVTLESRIENVYKDGNELRVQGSIYDANNEQVGEISRTFFVKDGTLNVEHGVLYIYSEEHKGTGFGKEFIQQSEAWYTAKGLGYIEIKSTAADGARHWARAGYDFAPNKVGENLDTISQRVASMDDEESGWFAKGSAERAEFDSLMSRATNDYSPYFEDESGYKYPAFGSVKNFTEENFPLPAEFANIGYSKQKAEEIGTWAGKELMYDLKVSYVKSLTAEGQKLLDGPIDHDGDGLIYDGTSREKPAPSKKN